MELDSKIYVAGHKGLVGSAIVRELERQGYHNIITRTHSELDLTDQSDVIEFFDKETPDYVFLAAGSVGGIVSNINNKAKYLYDNLMIQSNIIHQSYTHNVKKILVLGSSCIYPKFCKQPMKEEYLMDGKLEPTNEGYALSKIVSLKMSEFYNESYNFNSIAIMPCNLYGLNDSFDPINSHVLSATVKKFVDAVDNDINEVVMWGTGESRREFLFSDDLAEAAMLVMDKYESSKFINVGSGVDYSIKEIADKVAKYSGFTGNITWDTSKPDGMKLKCLDTTRITELGFKPKVFIDDGIKYMIDYYKKYKSNLNN